VKYNVPRGRKARRYCIADIGGVGLRCVNPTYGLKRRSRIEDGGWTIDDRESNPAILDHPSSILDPSPLLSYQRDIDQPLMGIGSLPTRGSATQSDCGGRPFLKGRLAVGHGMDFPLLGVDACAGHEGLALCHSPRFTLVHRHSELSPFPLSALNWPRHDEMTAVAGHDGEAVNGVACNPCEGQRGDDPPPRVRTMAAATRQFTRFLVG
jgi:hypothetical protein